MLSTNNPALPEKDKNDYAFAAEPKGIEARRKNRDPNELEQKASG